jgi:hypothetical protein
VNELFFGVIASIVGGIAMLALQKAYRFFCERASPFTDKWIGTSYDENGNLQTKDCLILRQRDENLHGKIERLIPDNQAHRKWHWKGKLRDKNLFAIFWSNSKNFPSYGTVFMRQKSDHEFTGYYLTFHEQVNQDGVSIGGLEKIPVTLVRKRDT